VFAENLYRECPRAAYELESMKYGLMARLGMGERDALELAVRIVAADGKTQQEEPMEKKTDADFKAEADAVLDTAIRDAMKEHGEGYHEAFARLQRDDPELLATYRRIVKSTQQKAIRRIK
jgi:hypothetical protein